MSGLKQLRARVKSIKSTQKITKAMQMVSAAKLKKIKDMAENINEYSDILQHMMLQVSAPYNCSMRSQEVKRFFSLCDEDSTPLLVVITSDRGLCGGFNSNILRNLKTDVRELKKIGKSPSLLVVGRKGSESLKKEFSDIIVDEYQIPKTNTDKIAYLVKNEIIAQHEKGKASSCTLYYATFKNAITQVFTKQMILPIIHNEDNLKKDDLHYYSFEGENLVQEIVEYHISGKINYALLQNRASEEGARMTAMDNATRNAGDLIDKLTIKLNRSRQAAITTELIEIIAGAEAV